jgi:hypothetical protein
MSSPVDEVVVDSVVPVHHQADFEQEGAAGSIDDRRIRSVPVFAKKEAPT